MASLTTGSNRTLPVPTQLINSRSERPWDEKLKSCYETSRVIARSGESIGSMSTATLKV
jgi:hypothetical protein